MQQAHSTTAQSVLPPHVDASLTIWQVSEPALAEKLAIAEANLISALQARNLESQLDFGDTAMLRRFLVARKLQIEPTVEMLLKHLDWRKATLPIELTPAVVTELKKGKTFLRGRDLQGRPLVVIRSACFDPKTRDLEASVRDSNGIRLVGVRPCSCRHPRTLRISSFGHPTGGCDCPPTVATCVFPALLVSQVKAFVHELEEALRSMPEGQSQLSIFYDRTVQPLTHPHRSRHGPRSLCCGLHGELFQHRPHRVPLLRRWRPCPI